MRFRSMYGDMSSSSGNEKWVLTFSFIIVSMLNVYRIVLKQRIIGSLLKHALNHKTQLRSFRTSCVTRANYACSHKTKFHLARHVTTRYLVHAFPHRKKSWHAVLCCACRAAQLARQARLSWHVFRGVAPAWTGVDMSMSLFPEIFPKNDANPEHNILYLYTRALLLLRHPPCWKQARRNTHNTLVTMHD